MHGETIILPTKFMEELKALPDRILNLDDEIDEVRCTNAFPPSMALMPLFLLTEIPFQVQLDDDDLSRRRYWYRGRKREERAHKKFRSVNNHGYHFVVTSISGRKHTTCTANDSLQET